MYNDEKIEFHRFAVGLENDINICHQCFDEHGNTNGAIAEFLQEEYGEESPCGEWIETKDRDDQTYDMQCGLCDTTGAEYQEELYGSEFEDDDELLESNADLETKFRYLFR